MDTDQRTKWLAARNGKPGAYRIGGSEVAAVMGWTDWDSPLSLYRRLLGIDGPKPDTDAAKAGRHMEDGIASLYADVTGRKVVCPVVARRNHDWLTSGRTRELEQFFDACDVAFDDPLSLVPKSAPWAVLSIDRFAYRDDLGWGIVDCKNVDLTKMHEWYDDAGNIAVPPEYSAQIAHYTHHSPFRWGGFAVLFGGNRIVAADIERARIDEIAAVTVPECVKFVNRCNAGTPPPVMPHQQDAETLRRLFGQRSRHGGTVAWAATYDAARESFDPEQFDDMYQSTVIACRDEWDRRRQLEAVLMAVAGESRSVILPNGTRYDIVTSTDGKTRIVRKKARGRR